MLRPYKEGNCRNGKSKTAQTEVRAAWEALGVGKVR